MKTLPYDYLAWKKSLRHNGSLYKNAKFYAYSQLTVPVGPKEAEISIKEANAIKQALKFQPLVDYLKWIISTNRSSPLSLKKIDHYFSKALLSDDVQQYLSKFVYRKLRFLAQSYGFSMQDLKSTLLNAAYFSLLKQYPNFEDFSHLIKLSKVAIHNGGINLITRETSKKRNVLEQNSDGTYYKNTTTLTPDAQSGASLGEAGYTLTSYLVTGIDGSVHSQWEKLFSLKQLVGSTALTDKQRKFLKLMLCEPDEEFANFIAGSTHDLYERDFEAYQKRVCEYLSVSYEKGERFLSSLQQFL
jgi:hypothetical protein